LIAGQQRDAWELIQRSHAIANGVYVASVNRIGREGRIKFWAIRSSPDPSARSSRMPAVSEKKFCWQTAT
jgi:predicted amidohydrolase